MLTYSFHFSSLFLWLVIFYRSLNHFCFSLQCFSLCFSFFLIFFYCFEHFIQLWLYFLDFSLAWLYFSSCIFSPAWQKIWQFQRWELQYDAQVPTDKLLDKPAQPRWLLLKNLRNKIPKSIHGRGMGKWIG